MIKIRRSSNDDISAIMKIYEHPENYAQTLQLPYPSLEVWRKFLTTPNEHFYSLVAELDGNIVGQLGIDCCSIPRRKHVANVGMAVMDGFQQQGIGQQLLEAAIDLAFNWLALSRIELEVYTDNNAAISLYKKVGFEQEGVAKSYAFKNGEYVDVLYMAKIKPKNVG